MTRNNGMGRILEMTGWAGILLGVALMGCQPQEPIRIGFVGGTSGRGADLGIAGRDGVQLAVERTNAAGGVSGRKVELVTRDDEQDPEVAKRVVRELVNQGVAAIVGPMTSAMGVAVVPVANEAETVLVSPTATTEALSGIDDHFFRVTSTTRVYASRNARYQVDSKHMRHIAAIYDLGNRAFTESWLKNFEGAFVQGGGELVQTVTFTSGETTSYLSLGEELLRPHPDGVLIVANSMDSALICQQIRKLDADIPITLADWGATERLLELGGKAVEGVTVVQTFDRDSTAPRYQEFRKAYIDRFQREPGFAGVYAFDAAEVILNTLEKRERGQNLREAILAIRQYEGLQSPFRFDDFGDVIRPHVSMSIVRDGRFVVIE